MKMFQGSCGVCFAKTGAFLKHDAYVGCGGNKSGVPEAWRGFAKAFVFEKFHYCYYCNMPQERAGNGEGPQTHRSHIFKAKTPCAWADFVVITLYCLWHIPNRRSDLLSHFLLRKTMDFEEFTRWVTQDDTPGEYFKGLEVFLWYCERWLEKGKGRAK
jgi:hypothetical protein